MSPPSNQSDAIYYKFKIKRRGWVNEEKKRGNKEGGGRGKGKGKEERGEILTRVSRYGIISTSWRTERSF